MYPSERILRTLFFNCIAKLCYIMTSPREHHGGHRSKKRVRIAQPVLSGQQHRMKEFFCELEIQNCRSQNRSQKCRTKQENKEKKMKWTNNLFYLSQQHNSYIAVSYRCHRSKCKHSSCVFPSLQNTGPQLWIIRACSL